MGDGLLVGEGDCVGDELLGDGDLGEPAGEGLLVGDGVGDGDLGEAAGDGLL